MGFFSSTWGDQAREQDKERRAKERDRRRSKRARKARNRREWVEHPVRTAWRSR
jgi:hypothetical protein